MVDAKLMLALTLTLAAFVAGSAEKLESLDEDFLSYLAEFEGDEDDWTIVEPVTAKTPPAAKPANDAPKLPANKTTPLPPKPATPDDGSKR
jgi:hypothetical protein